MEKTKTLICQASCFLPIFSSVGKQMNKNWGQNLNSKPKKSPKRLNKPPLVDSWAEEKDEESELVRFKEE